jgi:arylformamidase
VSVRDISILVRPGTPEWPGDTPYECRWTWQIARGASVNVSAITMSPHVGTHADAPLHVDDRWAGSDSLSLEAFNGDVWVADVRPCGEQIAFDDLSLPTHGVQRLLLRTGRSIAGGPFPAAWPCLTPDAAARLVAGGLRLLGVDAPSVDARDSKTLTVHRVLFTGDANILENLDLGEVAAGAYRLHAYPLRIAGLDAAPVRAVLEDLSPG